jgi:hypothetical protein
MAPDQNYSLTAPEHPQPIYVREKLKHWNTIDHCHLSTTYPLLSRGWAYQERLLAPRVLHFCQKELVWECMQKSLCECTSYEPAGQSKVEHSAAIRAIREIYAGEPVGSSRGSKFLRPISPSRITRWFWKRVGKQSQYREPSLIDFMEDAIKADRIRERDRPRVYRELRLWMDYLTIRWHEIIKHYSRLDLTIESDLLPAIAGLAREAEGCRTGSYLAGLWEDSLIEDLLWRVDQLGPGRSERRPALYRAPTS